MSMFRSCKYVWIVIASALVLEASAHAAGPILSLDDSAWTFEQMRAKFKASAQGVGRVKIAGYQGVDVTLLAGDQWTATIDGSLVLHGTYTREDATDRRLVLTFDAASIEMLQNLYAQQVEMAAAAEGVPLTVEVTLVEQKTLVKLKLRSRTGTAAAKLKARLGFSAVVSIPLGGTTPGKVVAKLKGLSAPVPMIDITGP